MFCYKKVITSKNSGTLELHSNRNFPSKASCRKAMESDAKETFLYWKKKTKVGTTPATYEEKDFDNIVVKFSTIWNESPDRFTVTYSIEEITNGKKKS